MRDSIMHSLKGEALVDGEKFNAIDLAIAVKKDHFMRAEIKGPLGIVLGVMQMNDDWLMLYIPNQGTVYRLPTEEAFKDTLRRARFFTLIPIPLYPEVMFDVMLTRVALKSFKLKHCEYLSKENVYALKLQNKMHVKEVWVDPTTMAPLKIRLFGLKSYKNNMPPDYDVKLSALQGAGLATLPSEIKVKTTKGDPFEFIWKKANVIQGSTKGLFNWWPKKAKLKDY